MKKYLTIMWLVLALVGGVFAGWVDFNNDEPQAAVLVILVVTFVLGLTMPGKAWLWAVIVALCLPGAYLFLHAFGYQPKSPPSPVWYASLLALIPAFMGAYMGTLTRVIANTFLKLERRHD
jgi:hypothetical protein